MCGCENKKPGDRVERQGPRVDVRLADNAVDELLGPPVQQVQGRFQRGGSAQRASAPTDQINQAQMTRAQQAQLESYGRTRSVFIMSDGRERASEFVAHPSRTPAELLGMLGRSGR